MIEIGQASTRDQIAAAHGYFLKTQVFEKMDLIDSALINMQLSYSAYRNVKGHFFSSVYDVWPGWYNLQSKLNLKQNKSSKGLAMLFNVLKITQENHEFFHSANAYDDLALYYQINDQVDSEIYYAEQGLRMLKGFLTLRQFLRPA